MAEDKDKKKKKKAQPSILGPSSTTPSKNYNEGRAKKSIKPLKKKEAKPVANRRPNAGHNPKLYKKGVKDSNPSQGTANTKEFLDKMDAAPGPKGYLKRDYQGVRVPAKGEKKVSFNRDVGYFTDSKKSEPGQSRSAKDYDNPNRGSMGESEYQTRAPKGSKADKYRKAQFKKETEASNKEYYRENPDRRPLKKSKPIKVSGKRTMRSKVGGAAMKVAGAVQKGKQAIRKINNKAGAVKNRLEEKVLKKKNK